MPEPDEQGQQPQPLVPEEAIPALGTEEGAAPAPPEDAALEARIEDAVPERAAAGNAAPAPADDADEAEWLLGGLRWSWELDFEALLAALSEPAPWNRPVRPAQP